MGYLCPFASPSVPAPPLPHLRPPGQQEGGGGHIHTVGGGLLPGKRGTRAGPVQLLRMRPAAPLETKTRETSRRLSRGEGGNGWWRVPQLVWGRQTLGFQQGRPGAARRRAREQHAGDVVPGTEQGSPTVPGGGVSARSVGLRGVCGCTTGLPRPARRGLGGRGLLRVGVRFFAGSETDTGEPRFGARPECHRQWPVKPGLGGLSRASLVPLGTGGAHTRSVTRDTAHMPADQGMRAHTRARARGHAHARTEH